MYRSDHVEDTGTEVGWHTFSTFLRLPRVRFLGRGDENTARVEGLRLGAFAVVVAACAPVEEGRCEAGSFPGEMARPAEAGEGAASRAKEQSTRYLCHQRPPGRDDQK